VDHASLPSPLQRGKEEGWQPPDYAAKEITDLLPELDRRRPVGIIRESA